jgi:4-hydroxybenzoate polyprenyltransferase
VGSHLTQPTGTILVFWPFGKLQRFLLKFLDTQSELAWGLTMAAYHTSLDLQTFWIEMFKYLIASFIVRGSACTINDIFDRNFDAGVGEPVFRYTASFPSHVATERTKGRPLASGRVSVFAAVVYLILQYLVGVLLYLPYKGVAFWAAIAQLLPL